MTLRYGDLPSTIGTGRKLADGSVILPRQPEMRCTECLAGPFSAERGDYWQRLDIEDVTCGECGGAMELGRIESRWVQE
jgi:hypothetical protein